MVQSLAWKWTKSLRYLWMISGRGAGERGRTHFCENPAGRSGKSDVFPFPLFGGHRLAVQVQAARGRVDQRDEFRPLPALVRKLVSSGPSGSLRLPRRFSPASARRRQDLDGVLMPCCFVMPGARFRCWGEPRTMIRPPSSPHSRARSPGRPPSCGPRPRLGSSGGSPWYCRATSAGRRFPARRAWPVAALRPA